MNYLEIMAERNAQRAATEVTATATGTEGAVYTLAGCRVNDAGVVRADVIALEGNPDVVGLSVLFDTLGADRNGRPYTRAIVLEEGVKGVLDFVSGRVLLSLLRKTEEAREKEIAARNSVAPNREPEEVVYATTMAEAGIDEAEKAEIQAEVEVKTRRKAKKAKK